MKIVTEKTNKAKLNLFEAGTDANTSAETCRAAHAIFIVLY